ncbi:MAG: hypothetical protein ACPGVU_19795 [Limisphaerales bacterium]
MKPVTVLKRLGMSLLPTIVGRIERRILVTVRVRPDVAARLIPAPLQPRIVDGWSIAGVCLIRLGQMRPKGAPRWLGLTSENAAHRFAVQWLENGRIRDGVYIPDRDTDTRLNEVVGGRLFPGIHHRAKFEVWESEGRWRIGYERTGRSVKTVARNIAGWPPGSVFSSLAEASEFYGGGCVGWSDAASDDGLDGVELSCDRWEMEPLLVERFESSYFQDRNLFPVGSVEFDSACLMRDIEHEWRTCGFLEPKVNDVNERAVPNLIPARDYHG